MNPPASTETWFVRVEGRQYGPVDFEALQEWKTEGRLIPQNQVCREGESEWISAASVPGLFEILTSDKTEASNPTRRRSLAEICAEAFRIYAKGFATYLGLSFLVALPSLGFRLSFAYVHYPTEGEALSSTARIAGGIAIATFALTLVMWPIFLGGLQFACGEIMNGRRASLREILRRAVNFWPRVARLSLFVYGSYIFWTALPVLIILTVAASPTVFSLFAALLALAFQVYMAGRLFINFMFWQQSCTLGGLEATEALRESKELARSQPEAPALQRPLYRGALVASVWLVIILMVSVAVEMPFMIMRLQGITTFEEAFAMVKTVSEAATPDWMTIASTILGTVLNAVLRPLLGIAFVVLYFDAKSTR